MGEANNKVSLLLLLFYTFNPCCGSAGNPEQYILLRIFTFPIRVCSPNGFFSSEKSIVESMAEIHGNILGFLLQVFFLLQILTLFPMGICPSLTRFYIKVTCNVFFFSSFLHCRFQICVGEYLCRSEVPTTAQIPIKDRKLEIPTVVMWIPLRVCVNIPLGSMGRKTRNKSAINMQQILT